MWSYRSRIHSESGFSLVEVVLVILIMGILASVAAQKYSGAVEQSRFDATRDEMDRIAVAVTGNAELTSGGVRSDFGFVGDVGALPPNLDALVANPGGWTTWAGPYIQSDFQQNPNDYKQDAWGATYTYSGVTLTSTGSGSAVTKQLAPSSAALLSNSVNGSVTDGRDNAPGDSSNAVSVSLTYPNGTGSTTTATAHPSPGGSFSFGSSIPMGNHLLQVTYHTDTVKRYVSVLPGSMAVSSVRLPGDLWTPVGSTGGGGSGGLVYVAGSAATPAGNHNMQFQVQNVGTAAVDLTSIRATYATAVYYQKVLIGGNQIFNDTNARGASGEIKTFPTVTISAGATAAIDYQSFRVCSTGSCGNGNVSGTSFTVLFSDGSSVTFTVP